MKIFVCKRTDVFSVASVRSATHVCCVSDDSSFPLNVPSSVRENNVLRMFFHDEDDPSHPHAPTNVDVRRILFWGQSLPDDAVVVVSCEGGLCRSPAIALMLLVQKIGRDLDGIRSAIDHLRSVNRFNCPNALLISYADSILKCNGVLYEESEKLACEHMIQIHRSHH